MPTTRNKDPSQGFSSFLRQLLRRSRSHSPVAITAIFAALLIISAFLFQFTILIVASNYYRMDQLEETSAAHTQVGWNFIVLMSRQGKIRLSEFFSSYTESEKRRILRDIAGDILPRAPKMCNIIEKGSYKFVYRRYASLYFVVGVPLGMNELIVLEQIHLFVEALDGYFNSVCELDLVFSLHKSLLILFEMFIGGMLCESNKREVLKAIVEAEEMVEEMTKPGEDTASQLDDGLSFQEQFQLGRKPGRRTGAGGR